MGRTEQLDRRRLLNLLADRALFGLRPAEAAEADHLYRQFPDIDLESFERTAAAISLAVVAESCLPMPGPVRQRVEREAMRRLTGKG